MKDLKEFGQRTTRRFSPFRGAMVLFPQDPLISFELEAGHQGVVQWETASLGEEGGGAMKKGNQYWRTAGHPWKRREAGLMVRSRVRVGRSSSSHRTHMGENLGQSGRAHLPSYSQLPVTQPWNIKRVDKNTTCWASHASARGECRCTWPCPSAAKTLFENWHGASYRVCHTHAPQGRGYRAAGQSPGPQETSSLALDKLWGRVGGLCPLPHPAANHHLPEGQTPQ